MEKPLRYTFVSDLSETHRFISPEAFKWDSLGKYCSRIPVKELTLSPDALSPENDAYLHAVEVIQKKRAETSYEIIIRVITNMGHGLNIHIPCRTNEMYEKYIDLRYQVRNSDFVLVTFPYITIRSSGERELYAYAKDFKAYNQNSIDESLSEENDYLFD